MEIQVSTQKRASAGEEPEHRASKAKAGGAKIAREEGPSKYCELAKEQLRPGMELSCRARAQHPSPTPPNKNKNKNKEVTQ